MTKHINLPTKFKNDKPGLASLVGKDMNKVMSLVESLSGFSGPGVIASGDNYHFADLYKEPFFARLTASTVDSDYFYRYAWHRVLPKEFGGWEDTPDGPHGQVDLCPAFEANNIHLPIGTIVDLRMAVDGTHAIFWYPLPVTPATIRLVTKVCPIYDTDPDSGTGISIGSRHGAGCCPEGIPDTLTISFSNPVSGTGDITCIVGTTITLGWVGSPYIDWQASGVTLCVGQIDPAISVLFNCQQGIGGIYGFTFGSTGPGVTRIGDGRFPTDGWTCDPFFITLLAVPVLISGVGSGSIDVIITE